MRLTVKNVKGLKEGTWMERQVSHGAHGGHRVEAAPPAAGYRAQHAI